jgi:hypothetical protein
MAILWNGRKEASAAIEDAWLKVNNRTRLIMELMRMNDRDKLLCGAYTSCRRRRSEPNGIAEWQ